MTALGGFPPLQPDPDTAPEMSCCYWASRKVEVNEGVLAAFRATIRSQMPPGFTSCRLKLLSKEKGARTSERGAASETRASSLRQNTLRHREEVTATRRQNCKIKDPGAAKGFTRSWGSGQGCLSNYTLLWGVRKSSGENTRSGARQPGLHSSSATT